MVQINGGCHCGNVSYELTWPDTSIVARRCSCTFCQKHNATWSSAGDAALLVRVADAAALSKYMFGTKTAQFYVCTRCGVPPVVVSEIDGQAFAVVNVGTINNAEQFEISELGTDFDGEDVEGRLQRRKKNWIGRVEIAGG